MNLDLTPAASRFHDGRLPSEIPCELRVGRAKQWNGLHLEATPAL